MITKRQAAHLSKIIGEYAEALADYRYEQDQGWGGSVGEAEVAMKQAKAKLDKYMGGITE